MGRLMSAPLPTLRQPRRVDPHFIDGCVWPSTNSLIREAARAFATKEPEQQERARVLAAHAFRRLLKRQLEARTR